MSLKKKLVPYAENIAESGTACLLTMVQGNVLLLGVSHWITASTTGLIAGTAAATALALIRTSNRLLIAGILGVITAVVDYFVHPGMIGESAFTEAAITGLGAAVLSYAAGTAIVLWQRRRRARAEAET